MGYLEWKWVITWFSWKKQKKLKLHDFSFQGIPSISDYQVNYIAVTWCTNIKENKLISLRTVRSLHFNDYIFLFYKWHLISGMSIQISWISHIRSVFITLKMCTCFVFWYIGFAVPHHMLSWKKKSLWIVYEYYFNLFIHQSIHPSSHQSNHPFIKPASHIFICSFLPFL